MLNCPSGIIPLLFNLEVSISLLGGRQLCKELLLLDVGLCNLQRLNRQTQVICVSAVIEVLRPAFSLSIAVSLTFPFRLIEWLLQLVIFPFSCKNRVVIQLKPVRLPRCHHTHAVYVLTLYYKSFPPLVNLVHQNFDIHLLFWGSWLRKDRLIWIGLVKSIPNRGLFLFFSYDVNVIILVIWSLKRRFYELLLGAGVHCHWVDIKYIVFRLPNTFHVLWW